MEFVALGRRRRRPGAGGRFAGDRRRPRRFRRLAGRDVADDGGVVGTIADGHPRDRRLDRELLPVGPERGERPQVAHRAGRVAGGAKGGDVAAVDAPEPLRQEAVERLADRLGRRAAEHGFGGRVEQHDPLLGVEGNDGVHRRDDDGGEDRGLSTIRCLRSIGLKKGAVVGRHGTFLCGRRSTDALSYAYCSKVS